MLRRRGRRPVQMQPSPPRGRTGAAHDAIPWTGDAVVTDRCRPGAGGASTEAGCRASAPAPGYATLVALKATAVDWTSPVVKPGAVALQSSVTDWPARSAA